LNDVVYSWEGPPALRLEREMVRTGDRRWIQHRLILQNGTDGAVVIGEKDGEVLLVQQFRPVVGELLWELPRGFAEASDLARDSEQTAVTTARREFAEETGMRLEDCQHLGRLWTDSGVMTGAVAVVKGRVAGDRQVRPPDGEIADTRWVPAADLPLLVTSGEVRDALSVAALGLWWAHAGGPRP
jgi:8-oxo-dGTP pyrophosphatase MutT (NUDIX family)